MYLIEFFKVDFRKNKFKLQAGKEFYPVPEIRYAPLKKLH